MIEPSRRIANNLDLLFTSKVKFIFRCITTCSYKTSACFRVTSRNQANQKQGQNAPQLLQCCTVHKLGKHFSRPFRFQHSHNWSDLQRIPAASVAKTSQGERSLAMFNVPILFNHNNNNSNNLDHD